MSTTTVSGPGDTPAEDPQSNPNIPLDGTQTDEEFLAALGDVNDETVAEIMDEPVIIDIAPTDMALAESSLPAADEALVIVEENLEGLFPDTYRVETPTFDNLASDKLILSLGGPIELDPTNPDDLALFENFMLGKSVNLLVHGSVVGKLGSYKENADGEVTVTGKAAVKIHSLTLQSA